MKRTLTLIAAFGAVALLSAVAQADTGAQIFAKKCTMCHKVGGGGMGPDLSKVAGKMKEHDIRAKLEDPKKSNPSSMMPSFKNLSKADANALVGYLKTLK